MNERAEKLFSRLVQEMAKFEGVTETLKATDMMAWVGRMNNIRQKGNRDRLRRDPDHMK